MASLILFVLVLVAAGGFIAWLGDRLGTRVGKKRLSIFGLRPRHTAMLVTIGAGVGIAAITVVILVSYDFTVRRALLHGQEIITANRRLTQENGAQQRHIAAQQTQIADGTARLAEAQAKLAPILGQLAGARAALGRGQEALRQRQAQLEGAQSQLTKTRQTLGATHADLSVAEQRVQSAKQALTLAHVRVQSAQHQVQTLSKRGLLLAAQNAGLQHAGLALAARATASRQNLIYRTGQELGRIQIKTPQPVVSVEQELAGFLGSLSRQAAGKSGKLGVNRRAVAIAVPTASGDYKALPPAQEREAVRALAQNIAGAAHSAGGVVVVAQAAYNAFQGEQTDIELHPYDNVLIYPKDAVVASETINGAQPETEVISELQAFLSGKVRPAALRSGLIPQTDPQTGRPVVGALDQNTSLALVRQILQIGGPVRVTASADQDIYSSGPLALRLSAAPAEAAPAAAKS